MKFRSKLLLPVILLTSFTAVKINAVQDKIVKTAAATIVAATEIADNKNAIQKADAVICEFCFVIKEFFNKANKEGLGSHANKFASVIASVDSLIAEVQASFQESESIKEEAFLNILKELQNSLKHVHNALNTGSASTIICAFKNHLSKSYIKNLKVKLENTKKYLTENELKLVNNILKTSESILKGIPGDVSCAAIITKKSPNM